MKATSALVVLTGCVVLAACTSSSKPARLSTHSTGSPSSSPPVTSSTAASVPAAGSSSSGLPAGAGLDGMPPLLNSHDVYAADRPGRLSPTVAHDPAYVYVPDTNSNDVYVIDQHTRKVVRTFYGGNEPQHVVPSWDLKTLYITADKPGAGSLIAINPRTGKRGARFPVDDAYNMYFTPNGQYAIVVQEAYTKLAFYDPHTWRLHDVLTIPSCQGIDHMDFTAAGTKLLVSCEFANRMAIVDVAKHTLLRTFRLSPAAHGMPQDVKLSPDGKHFYIADMTRNGIYVLDADTFHIVRFQPTGVGAHGLYIARDSRRMFVTNRDEGTISVLNAATGRPEVKWRLPGGGSPDMGNVSADGRLLWLSGRYDNAVYAINTATGHLVAKIPVGAGPHGLCVWPQPGRYSLGHTGILR
jgi:YVTN family beta-propeller protein